MKHNLSKRLSIIGLTTLLGLNMVAAQATPTPISLPSLTLNGHMNTVTALAWSPDGNILASSAGYFDSQDNVVRLWQPDGQPLATLIGHTLPVVSLAWSPDGSMLATGSQDQTIKLWTPDGSLIRTFQADAGIVFALAWSPDGNILASGSVAGPEKNTVQLWNTDGNLVITRLTQYSGGKFYNLGWSPDGQYLVGGATDYNEWKADGTLVVSHDSCAHCTPAWGFAWSPDSRLWVIGNESGLLWVYGAEGQQILQSTSTAGIDLIRWSPDGQWMAAGKDLWKVDDTKFVLKNYVKGLNGALDWSPNSRYIASAGEQVVYIQQANGKPVAILKGHTDEIDVLAWSPKGNVLASGSADHTIHLWDVSSLTPERK